jgi:16S rRNA (cytosine967-C5)-methyltransferase
MAEVCQADLMQAEASESQGAFDRILLDAPCSGLGTLRRNPDIKWSAHKKDLSRYRDIQTRLLERVSAWLKSRGSLVYAVCSPEPEETLEVVEAFITGNPGFRVDGLAGGVPEIVRPLIDAHGFLQTYPHLSYMDGFFAVRFKTND